ncbi:MAG TPA: uroporphyrinogen-III C-methyltransferase [Ideonella sp.]|uniref:uroporphyrinogen-III C-methyltransferase n=1 Tax=Ideonella sp. TaxID=1929293 RepID=UPI002E325CDD|nr:uroporphyrinogen-III C-methyltransferase [Ideonella sp.]HEX5685700.1 uroporphyrinogen-III C-methyltransferase [Ideonella sp.]
MPSPASVAPSPARGLMWPLGALALTVLSVASLSLVWSTQQRVKSLEQELVRRQQSSQDQSTEARLLARQAHDAAADVAAKLALVEARVAESALQRTQVEELIQSLSRSRDENVLADVEAGLRVAQQQSAITGSAEPMVAVLRQADERLARYNQPRLERVRRAVARDLDRVRAVTVADVPSLSIKLDEAVRQVDELPMLVNPERKVAVPAPAAASAPPRDPSASAVRRQAEDWLGMLDQAWQRVAREAWAEVRSLVRVTRIDQPEAMLVAPEQAYFLRENLKLRLLNARLALLSRQFDQAQSDLAQAQASLERYFDRSSRRVNTTAELLRQVASQTRQVNLPRPDETLAALAAASAGR